METNVFHLLLTTAAVAITSAAATRRFLREHPEATAILHDISARLDELFYETVIKPIEERLLKR